MGACIKMPGPAIEIRFQLPGGAVLTSLPSATQQLPNILDPFQVLLQASIPALGPIKPVFDIVGFVMCVIELITNLMALLGALMTLTGAVGNPLSLMFPLPNMKDENGDDISPPVPDATKVVLDLLNSLLCLLGKGMKVGGLVPQLSVAVTVKDAVITAIQFLDAIMAQLNSLIDALAAIPAPTTGDLSIDAKLDCVNENAQLQIQAKLGVAGGLVPLMALVSTLAKAASKPLPRVIYTSAKILADDPPTGFKVLPFPDQQSKDAFLQLLDDMTTTGLPFEIPDFSDLSDLPAKVQELKQSLAPILEAIQLLQMVLEKISKAGE